MFFGTSAAQSRRFPCRPHLFATSRQRGSGVLRWPHGLAASRSPAACPSASGWVICPPPAAAMDASWLALRAARGQRKSAAHARWTVSSAAGRAALLSYLHPSNSSSSSSTGFRAVVLDRIQCLPSRFSSPVCHTSNSEKPSSPMGTPLAAEGHAAALPERWKCAPVCAASAGMFCAVTPASASSCLPASGLRSSGALAACPLVRIPSGRFRRKGVGADIKALQGPDGCSIWPQARIQLPSGVTGHDTKSTSSAASCSIWASS